MTQSDIWLFDLDNTLHNADAGVFYTINRAMTAYLGEALNLDEAAASDLRQDYWHRYGATLAGLQKHHPEISVLEFLQRSHPLDKILSQLSPMEGCVETLTAIKGTKVVFSNGPSFYVQALIYKMGLEAHFSSLLGTDDFGLLYKPADQAYLTVCHKLSAAPERCIMIDDSADNLYAAKALGMRTVWFGQHTHPLPFVDFAAADMQELRRWAMAHTSCLA
ncbi:MAG: pyrimidine 5'-nucleotidase [Neisseria sp.]